MKYGYLVLLVSTFLIVSCENDKSSAAKVLSSSDLKTITVKPERNKKIELSTVVKGINFIPLETNKNSLMGKPTKIEFDAGKYFIYDRDVAKAVFVFDSTGLYINQISKRGKGPGEFHEVSGFTLNRSRKEILVGDNCRWLKKFNYSGEHISDSSVKLFYRDLALIKNGSIAFSARKMINYSYNDNFFSQKVNTECFNLWITNTNAHTIKYFPFDIKLYPNGSLYQAVHLDFCRYKDQLMYTLAFSDTIYKIQADHVSTKYFIDFGTKRSKENLTTKNGEWILSYYKSDPEYAYMVTNFLETDNIIKFDYTFGQEMQTAIFNKKDNNLLTGELDNDIFGLPLVLYQSIDNKILTYISPFELHDLLKKSNDKAPWVKYLQDLCSKYNEDDNYILVEIELY